ncbi:hypothetical protein [Cryobacterium tagatosivorans]|uniref:Uncharacterized protein n=1 Tax=Cryobacterium tagatosivorans TaxID=1259199 RepID=A0A4R8UFE1_9MICO|nr:hypothetical protein [Cryobacterium tagatosivorans]TFB52571.1 hypothetical protein E3O23_06130 [Cryobacterium tagatosivorans]
MIVNNVRGTRSRGLAAGALAASVAFLLSACASSVPLAQETNGSPAGQSASPTTTPAPLVSAIVMSGSQLVSETAGGQPVATVDFEQGTDAAVAFLTAALGVAPEQPPASDDACRGTLDASYAWATRASQRSCSPSGSRPTRSASS